MAMMLVSKEVLRVETIPNNKFQLNPSCSLCSAEFDSSAHLPKFLSCGHTLCVQCIDRIIKSIQVSHSGDGDAHTHFVCTICRSSMEIPHNGASGFPNNFQLLSASKDARYINCTTCDTQGNETTFHICRECTIQTHDFDVHTILTGLEPALHPDSFVVCSTCVLKEHNTAGHTVIEYLPIRLNYQYQSSILSVNVHSAQAVEKFARLRTILTTLPILVEKKEKEVSNMVELVQKAKSSQSQRLIFEKYKDEITQINKMLDQLITEGGKLNTLISEKAEILCKMNAETSAIHCLPEIPNMVDVLKISQQNDPPIDPIVNVEEDIVLEDVEEPTVVPVAIPPVEMEPNSYVNFTSSMSRISSEITLKPILNSIMNFIIFVANWLYSLRLTQRIDINNFNNEDAGVERQWIIISFGLIFVTFIVFKLMF